MTYSILVVDDDNRIRDLLGAFLTKHNYLVTKANCSLQARGYINAQAFDLIILDIMMPGDEDGLMLAKSLRSTSDIPIILLTARDSLTDKIDGLNFGADDYIIKPFEPDELLARIQSLLRRVKSLSSEQKSNILKFGTISFDLKTARLFDKDLEEIFLSSTEQLLLKVLAQNPFKPLSREEMSQRAGFIVNERTIDVQVTRLRKKLEDDVSQPKYIKTVRHVGYALYPEKTNES